MPAGYNRPRQHELHPTATLQGLAAILSNGEGSINAVSPVLREQGHHIEYDRNGWLARFNRWLESGNVVGLMVGPARAHTRTPLTSARAEAAGMHDAAGLLSDFEGWLDGSTVTSVELEILDSGTPGANQRGAHNTLANGATPIFSEWRLRLRQHSTNVQGVEMVNYVTFTPYGDLRGHSFTDDHGQSDSPEAIAAAVSAAEVMAIQLGFGV